MRPESGPPHGAFSTLPYDFGIVVKSFDVSADYVKRNLVHSNQHLDVSQEEGGQVRQSAPQDLQQASGAAIDDNISARRFSRRSDEIETHASNYAACAQDTTLSVTLEEGVLHDVQGRVGLIVASNQFQFDGPPPQHGAIFCAGWLVTGAGYLALGNSTTFYQCRLGEHFNLYDEPVASQCEPVVLEIVELTTC